MECLGRINGHEPMTLVWDTTGIRYPTKKHIINSRVIREFTISTMATATATGMSPICADLIFEKRKENFKFE